MRDSSERRDSKPRSKWEQRESRDSGRDSARRETGTYDDDRAKRRSRGDAAAGSSSRHREHDSTLRRDSATARRSRSPDFERDRARERRAYEKGSASRDRHEGRDEAGRSERDSEGVLDNSEPNFGSSGLLAKESNSKNGVTLKYFEPPEARKPKKKWRLYIFDKKKEVDLIHISQQSCYLLGRDQAVADIPVSHPSISKQHAVIQFRSITHVNEFGDENKRIKPFLIDLDPANGSFVNGRELPPSRYYELKNGDTFTLAGCEYEFVLLMEQ